MKYIEEFRDQKLAKHIAERIRHSVDPAREYHFMEFCGGHTHAIFRYGVQDLMPGNVHYVHGPGCPVCVLPTSRIDLMIRLLREENVILCTYADLLRVPASERESLMKVKAEGADVRMVYSTQDALKIARDNPESEVVFFAIGFETTTPPTAVAILQAQSEQLSNFTVFCNHVLTPAAMSGLLDAPAVDGEVLNLDGFLGPSHVSSIIGSQPYEFVPQKYGKPVVIAGFEPLDVMQSTLMMIQQINDGRCEVENEYARVVSREGNRKAQALVAEVLELRDRFEWRGLGWIPDSALKIQPRFSAFDAEQRFDCLKNTGDLIAKDHKACECPSILRGTKKPVDCKLFGTVCTPENPMGSCMVSSEGACAAHWSYGRFRGQPVTSSPQSQKAASA
ncbi:MAG: hydrogenase formation protein HypD [Oceanospirillaceae bacterium]|nr:hydrogenase formation protein HypD [Oceanospirillaceae bacterium]|tara:strand:+ start:1759 stop:2934 length:1176 start_codon:yes stop_codon:yes gene_type:complete